MPLHSPSVVWDEEIVSPALLHGRSGAGLAHPIHLQQNRPGVQAALDCRCQCCMLPSFSLRKAGRVGRDTHVSSEQLLRRHVSAALTIESVTTCTGGEGRETHPCHFGARMKSFDPARPTPGMRRLFLLPCCMAGPGLAWRTPFICNRTGLGSRLHLTVDVSAACFHPFR